jgi:hypothetical protein
LAEQARQARRRRFALAEAANYFRDLVAVLIARNREKT